MTAVNTANPLTLTAKLAYLCALLVVGVGVVVLLGWASDIMSFLPSMASQVSMKPNAALCFILTGVALILTIRTHQSAISNQSSAFRISLFARFFGLLAGLIGLLSLGEYIFHWKLGIDLLLFNDSDGALGMLHPGLMPPEEALNFVLLSIALLFVGSSRQARWTFIVPVGLILLVTNIALSVLLAHFMPSLGDYGWFGLTIMMPRSAVLFLLLTISIIAISLKPEVLQGTPGINIAVAVACGMALLVFIVINNNRSQLWMQETESKIAKIEQMLVDKDTLKAKVTDAHIYARNFLATNNKEFLKLYYSANADTNTALDKLRQTELWTTKPVHHQHPSLVEAHVEAQFQMFLQIVEAIQSDAAYTVRNNVVIHGKELLDNLHVILDRIESEDRQIIQQMRSESESISRFTRSIILIGSFVSLLVFLAVIFRINYYKNRRMPIAPQLEEQT